VERMTPMDSWFIHVEDDVELMHIGSVGIFEGPAPHPDDLRLAFDRKLDLVPRCRQRVTPVPFGVARPVWSDDPHFSLEYHIRQTALPSPGDPQQLRNLVGRVMGQRLDLRRPLWETWIIEGVEDGRWALLSKVHHSMVDGVAGTDMLALLLDGSSDPAAPQASGWSPDPVPSRGRLLRDAAVELITRPSEQWRVVRSLTRGPRAATALAMGLLRGSAALTGVLRPLPASSLTGTIGPHRRWAMGQADLDAAKQVRRVLGGTVNDVVLAAITSGYRELLDKRGELDEGHQVRTLVPVSLRTADQQGEMHNRVAALFVELPVQIADPIQRYLEVRDTMARMKGSGEQLATAAFVGMSGIAPPMLVGLALRSATWLLERGAQRFVTTLTTNVPGPQQPLELLGRRMLRAYPYVPIAEGLRTGVAIFSYDGMLTFGITADYDTVPDIDVLTDAIERGVAELVEAAERGEVAQRF
jgi:diacylglycerol O-acyltransferase / wax synthase